jgi:hypothetical protein
MKQFAMQSRPLRSPHPEQQLFGANIAGEKLGTKDSIHVSQERSAYVFTREEMKNLRTCVLHFMYSAALVVKR